MSRVHRQIRKAKHIKKLAQKKRIEHAKRVRPNNGKNPKTSNLDTEVYSIAEKCGGKRRYASVEDAAAGAMWLLEGPCKELPCMYVYTCYMCSGYHVSKSGKGPNKVVAKVLPNKILKKE